MNETYMPIFRNQRSMNQPLVSGGNSVAAGNSIAGGNSIAEGNEPAFTTYSKKIGKRSLFNDRPKMFVSPRFTTNQQEMINQIIQQAQRGLQDPYEGFQPLIDEAMSNFYTKTVPTIAERFTSMGQGAQRSSAFQAALAEGGGDLNRSLLAEKARYGLQNKTVLSNLLGIGMQPSYEASYMPGGPDAAGRTISNVGGIAASLLGKYLGGLI